jgi:hypothetical protein
MSYAGLNATTRYAYFRGSTKPLPLSVFGDTPCGVPLTGFGFWRRRFGPREGGVLPKLRWRRLSSGVAGHGLYQPMRLARVPMGPWS